MFRRALLLCGCRLLLAQVEDGSHLDSLALVQSRMQSRTRPTDSRQSQRCAAPSRRCPSTALEQEAPMPDTHIIITRSRGEDLRWLDTVPEMITVVYNRQGMDELLPAPRPNLFVVRQEEDPVLSKLGAEDGMLRHIVNNWERLPEVALFLQAWPFADCADARDLLARAVRNAKKPYDPDLIWNGAQPGLVPLTSTFYHYDVQEGQVGAMKELLKSDPKLYDPNIGVELFASLAFNKTCSRLLHRPCNMTMWVAQGSQWAVSRELLMKTPREAYQRMLDLPSKPHPRIKDVVLEALWPQLWGHPLWTPGMLPQRAAPVMNPSVHLMYRSMNSYCAFGTGGTGLQKDCEEDAGFCLYSRQQGEVAQATGSVEIRPVPGMRDWTPMAGGKDRDWGGICPPGYSFDDGTVSGGNQVRYGLVNVKDTIDQCAEECSGHDLCLSFAWSAKTKVCNLKKYANPISSRDADFVFCRSDKVPASEVVESPPEMKVPAYLEGAISVKYARQLRAREAESDIWLRLESAFARDSSKLLERRMQCSERHLPQPPLAISGKKWRLVGAGYPYYHIQVSSTNGKGVANCLIEPEEGMKRPVTPCSASRSDMRWELKQLGNSSFQLVAQSGRCLLKGGQSPTTGPCEASDSTQAWKMDLSRTGKVYERLTLETTLSSEGELQMQCVLQLADQSEVARPAGLQRGGVLQWRMVNASASHGENSYFLATSQGSYLACPPGEKRPQLQKEASAWRLRDGDEGSVAFQAAGGALLVRKYQDGGLLCAHGGGEDDELPEGARFTLGIPKATAPPLVQLDQQPGDSKQI